MSAASSEHNLSPALGDTDAAALTTTKPKFWYGSPTPTNGLSPIDSQRRVSSVGGGIDGADSIAGGATTRWERASVRNYFLIQSLVLNMYYNKKEQVI